MTAEHREIELEIRTTSNFYSNDADTQTNVNVVSDTLHPNDLKTETDLRLYVENTHDQGVDIEVYHTHSGDADYSGEIQEGATINLTAGDTSSTADTMTITGPVGKLRFRVVMGTTAPTTGTLTVQLVSR